jgi:hypothetical protein
VVSVTTFPFPLISVHVTPVPGYEVALLASKCGINELVTRGAPFVIWYSPVAVDIPVKELIRL